jgi:hypothetical protein
MKAVLRIAGLFQWTAATPLTLIVSSVVLLL